jgi:hypothetical protein
MKDADNARLAHPAMHLKAKAGELLSDEIRGPDLFIAEFGMLVQ